MRNINIIQRYITFCFSNIEIMWSECSNVAMNITIPGHSVRLVFHLNILFYRNKLFVYSYLAIVTNKELTGIKKIIRHYFFSPTASSNSASIEPAV